jgi:DNA helicase-2/ATP-dependent DNA helicase PcrA
MKDEPIFPAVDAIRSLQVSRGADDYLGSLNPQQRIAVEHRIETAAADGPAPLLIIAGAGSGKTNTLAHRVAHLVLAGADPQRILLLTFTRRAADEMERRAGIILSKAFGAHKGQRPPTLPWTGTFHAIGARLLREYAERVGLNASFTIHDRGDAEDLLAIVRHGLGLSKTEKRFPGKEACLAIYSRAVNSAAPLSEVLKSAFPQFIDWESELKGLFEAYVGEKQSQNALDYDDLLLYWSYIVAEPELAREIGGRFDHILVDEYQDTNRLQAEILLGMKPDGKGLTVVGDDAQSIYSFRAATVRNILGFPQQFEPKATIVTLERNYRSTQPILAASNAVIGLASERYTKNLWTERLSSERPGLVTVRDPVDQARCVADRVLEYREAGIALKSQAVLFRSSSHSAQLELELARRGIPFVKYGGLKFLEAAHIKDALSILRWAENPASRLSGFRVAKLLPGVGPATAGRLLDAMETAPDPLSAMHAFNMPRGATQDWTSLVGMYERMRSGNPAWPAEMEMVLRWYEAAP